MDKKNLRKKAEKKLSEMDINLDDKMDIKELIHELKVHQIELKQQNDELKRYQNELQESRDKYHLLYERAPAGYFTFNREGVIIDLNFKACQLLDNTRKSLLNKPLMLYLPPQSQDKFYIHRQQVLEQQGMKKCDLKIKRKDGKQLTVQLESSCLPGENNKIMTAIVNITERVQARNKLQQQKNLLQGVINGIPDIIGIQYPDHTIDYYNQAGLDFLGLTAEELNDKKCFQLLGKSEECEVCATRQSIKSQKIEETEKYIPKKDIYLNCRSNPVLDENGDIIRIVEQLRDITEEKKREEKLNNYTMELELKSIELEQLYNQLDQEIDKALNIHKQTLPSRLPDCKNISVATYYQPAEKLGGDIYDIIKQEDKIIFYIADVTGHGLEAALMSNFVKNTITSYINIVKPKNITPEKIIKFLADQFQNEDYPEDYFICIYIGILDKKNLELSYTGLGFQDNPILMGKNRQKNLISKGLPISKVTSKKMLNVKTNEIFLNEGDTLVFNTDGLTEQTNNKNYYLNRFQNYIYNLSQLPPEMIKQLIKEDFYQFNNNSYQGQDDITFLILQKKDKNRDKYQLEIKKDHKTRLSELEMELINLLAPKKLDTNFVMAVKEMAVNAYEHGNRMDENLQITIEIVTGNDFIYASIEDEGPGFNWRDKVKANLELEQERGRGIIMARMAVDHLLFNQKGNIAFLLKYFKD